MSAAAMDWALRAERVQAGVHGVRRTVLIVLTDHANDAGEASLSTARLIAESGYSRNPVQNALGWLAAEGWIENGGWRERCRVRRLALTHPTTRGESSAQDLPHEEGHVARDMPHDLPHHLPHEEAHEPEPEPKDESPSRAVAHKRAPARGAATGRTQSPSSE